MADRDAPIAADESASPPPLWRRPLPVPARWALRILGAILLLILLGWAVLYITKGRFLKHPFERIASGATHRQVRVAGDFQLYFDWFNVKFVAEGLTIANPDWAKQSAPDFFRAKRIDSRISTWSLLFGKRRINWLGMQDGQVDLQWNAARQNTWTFGDGKGKPLELPIVRRAIVAGTAIHYSDPRMRMEADIRVRTVRAQDTRFANAVRFDGAGRVRGRPFTLTGALLSPNATVTGGQNRLDLTARAVRSTLHVAGTLPGATEIEGAKLHMDLRGADLAEVFALAGIALPDTRRYRLTSALTKAGDAWRFTGLKGRFGDSDLAGRLIVTLGAPRLKLDADLATRQLDIIDAGPFIGYDPERLAARGAAGAVRQVAGTPRVLPDTPLRIDALRNFDADVHWTVARVRAEDVPVSNIELGLDLNDRLLKLSPLNFAMARGTVSSDITIDARRDPVFTDYDIRLSPTPMGVLLKGFGVAESGTSGTLKARIKMTGTGNSVRDSLASANGRIAVILPRGTFWTRNTELSELDLGVFVQKMFEHKLKAPVEINCGLIGFTVRNGVAAADPILIDTQKNVMLGRGGFSFRDESIDLAMRADSKKFSLFSGQSPVGVGGHFAAPSIDVISPELLGRAGASIGLGALVSPVAAVLAFVDIGDAKSTDCGPVLAGAHARAQRDTKGRPRDDVGKGTPKKG